MPRKIYGLDQGLLVKGKLKQGVNKFQALDPDNRGTDSESLASYATANTIFSDGETPRAKPINPAKLKMAKEAPLSQSEYEKEQKRKMAVMAMMADLGNMRAFEIRNADVVAPQAVDAKALKRERAKRHAGGWMDPDAKAAMKVWGELKEEDASDDDGTAGQAHRAALNRRLYGNNIDNIPAPVQRGDARAARGGRGAQAARGGYAGARGGRKAKPVIQADGTFAMPVLQERRSGSIPPAIGPVCGRGKSPPPKVDRRENRETPFAKDRRNKQPEQEENFEPIALRARAGNRGQGAAPRARGGPIHARPVPARLPIAAAAPVFNLMNNDEFMAKIEEEREAKRAAAAAVANAASMVQAKAVNTGMNASIYASPPKTTATEKDQTPKPAKTGATVSGHKPEAVTPITEPQEPKPEVQAPLLASPDNTTTTDKDQTPKPVLPPQPSPHKERFKRYDPELMIALGAKQRPADGLSELFIHPDELPMGGVTASKLVDLKSDKERRSEVNDIIARWAAFESESQSDAQSERPPSFTKPRMTPDPKQEIVWHKVKKASSTQSKALKKENLPPRSNDLSTGGLSPYSIDLAETAPKVKPPTQTQVDDDFDDFLSQVSATISLPKAKRPSEILQEELGSLSFEEAKEGYKQVFQPRPRENAIQIVPRSAEWEEAEKKRKAAKKAVVGIEGSKYARPLDDEERRREEAILAPTGHLFKNYNQRKAKKNDYVLPSWLAEEMDNLVRQKSGNAKIQDSKMIPPTGTKVSSVSSSYLR